MCDDVRWCVLMCADMYSCVLMCTDVTWCVQVRCTTTYHDVLERTATYYDVLRRNSTYVDSCVGVWLDGRCLVARLPHMMQMQNTTLARSVQRKMNCVHLCCCCLCVLMWTHVHWCLPMRTCVLLCADACWCVLMCSDLYWCVLMWTDVYRFAVQTYYDVPRRITVTPRSISTYFDGCVGWWAGGRWYVVIWCKCKM